MLPSKLNRRRARLVLARIDEILAWEQGVRRERDTRFVELGQYLCEVRAGRYWRLEHLANFDDFLARRFPGSRRRADYLTAIHEQLPKPIRQRLPTVGWSKAVELAKLARREGSTWIVQSGCTRPSRCPLTASSRRSSWCCTARRPSPGI